MTVHLGYFYNNVLDEFLSYIGFLYKLLSCITVILYCTVYCFVHNMLTSAVDGGRTEEGLDYMFATNYVGHFLLTMLLLGK